MRIPVIEIADDDDLMGGRHRQRELHNGATRLASHPNGDHTANREYDDRGSGECAHDTGSPPASLGIRAHR